MRKSIKLTKSDSPTMFNRISSTYDFLNRLLSFGLDQHWRKQLVKQLPENLEKYLDLATGTGDQLFLALKKHPRIHQAIGIDLATKMLNIAKTKAKKKHLEDRVSFDYANAQQLPYPDNFFDAISLSFGIRNFSNLSQGLKESFRVLKSQGRLLILEFSIPKNQLLSCLHLLYLRYILPALGGIISRYKDAYVYLNQTIETFPYGESFAHLLYQTGFKRVTVKPLFGGIVTLYQADK